MPMSPSLRPPFAAALAAAALVACVGAPPTVTPAGVTFRLPPASLGRTLAWQQRLQVVTTQGPAPAPLDALLEADGDAVRLVLLGAGQTLARLQWDGRSLQAEQSARWPKAISAERVLSDMQLALWPLAALQAALPADTSVSDEGPLRVLRQRGEIVTTVRDPGSTHIELVNQALGYTLRIDSVPLEGAAR